MRTSDFDPITIEIFANQLKKITLIILFVFGILILRFWFLQIVNGPTYRIKSESNRIRLQDILPFRGKILDRNGTTLVDNRPSFDLYVIPEEVQNQSQLLDALAHLADVDKESSALQINEGLKTYPFRPICLKKDLSRNRLALVETHLFNLPGVIIKATPQRHYLYNEFASHLIGYLGEISERQLKRGHYPDNKAGDLIGKSGIEWRWQSYLNGVRGGEQVEVDATGRKIRVMVQKPPEPGTNVHLTLEKDIQFIAEMALVGKKGGIVALDPTNGKILALASGPSFDPNMFVGGIDRASWAAISLSTDFPLQNRALSGQYAPGSVFKIIVALAALQEGVIDPEEEITCYGSYRLGNRAFRCWKRHGHGKMNLHKALEESCDVYFYEVGSRLGIDKIAQYATKFGLGKKTGFDKAHEKPGLIPTSQWKLKRFGEPWQGGETLIAAIGQSFLLVTPIQIASLVATTFNGGIVYQPQVTGWVGTAGEKKLHEFAPKIRAKINIDEKHLDIVKNALIAVVNGPHGTARNYKLKDITMAGKTGTSQVTTVEKQEEYGKEEEVPYEYRDHAWFTAVAPAVNPQIAVAVLVEHGMHGASGAAPIAGEIIQAYLNPKKKPEY